MAPLALKLGLLAAVALLGLTAGGLLLAALVAALQPVTGLAAALAITAAGLLATALALTLILRRQARQAQARRDATARMLALADLALMLLPKQQLRRLQAALAAGAGLATALALILRPPDDPDT